MEKSIMAMADDILGGTLSSPAKVVSKPVVQEHELPEMNDSFRESLIEGSVMNEETKTPINVPLTPGQRLAMRRPTNTGDTGAELRARRRAAGLTSTPEKPGAPKPTGGFDRIARAKALRAQRARAQSRLRDAPTTKENLEILLKARDILREMTGVGSIGVGPQITGSRAHSTHGADMGKDTVPVQAPDKAMPKEKKSKKKKVKKESFDRFLDRVINEHQERR
jgi:hypothetical protein